MTGYDPTDGTRADKDGFADCERQIFQRCTPEETRDSNGKCRAKDDCAQACDGGQGTIAEAFGTCVCDNTVTLNEVCNKECLSTLPESTFTSDGGVLLHDPVTNTTIYTKLGESTIGTAACALPDGNCKIVTMRMSDNEKGDFNAVLGQPQNSIPEDKKFIQKKFKSM